MRTIETTVRVGADRHVVLELPADVSEGLHQVIVIVLDQGPRKASPSALRFSLYPVGLISEQTTFRREDLYGADGR